jgi:hypothetical protein
VLWWRYLKERGYLEGLGVDGTYWYEINTYRVLVGIPKGKRLVGRSRCRWDNKTDLKEQDGKRWSGFFWLRTGPHGGNLFKAVINFTVLYNGDFLTR